LPTQTTSIYDTMQVSVFYRTPLNLANMLLKLKKTGKKKRETDSINSRWLSTSPCSSLSSVFLNQRSE